ncbi:hypothetical protein lerEdw1_021033 [Lerista edwardsae]|nr:hypothetical protein lerEdw1_021033 [Lerista edwardsae]
MGFVLIISTDLFYPFLVPFSISCLCNSTILTPSPIVELESCKVLELVYNNVELGGDRDQEVPCISRHSFCLSLFKARFSDKDSSNRFIGLHLYTDIQKNDHCYMMMRVSDFVVTNVLSKLKNKYPKTIGMSRMPGKESGENEEQIGTESVSDSFNSWERTARTKSLGSLICCLNIWKMHAPKHRST